MVIWLVNRLVLEVALVAVAVSGSVAGAVVEIATTVILLLVSFTYSAPIRVVLLVNEL